MIKNMRYFSTFRLEFEIENTFVTSFFPDTDKNMICFNLCLPSLHFSYSNHMTSGLLLEFLIILVIELNQSGKMDYDNIQQIL
jgi:hypothetical protein